MYTDGVTKQCFYNQLINYFYVQLLSRVSSEIICNTVYFPNKEGNLGMSSVTNIYSIIYDIYIIRLCT